MKGSHAAAEGLEIDHSYKPSYSDLEDVEDFRSYSESRVIVPGQYPDKLEVGSIGSQMFYVQDEDHIATSVAGGLMADALMEELGVEGPEIFYDADAGKLLVEEVEGVPTKDYRVTHGLRLLKHLIGSELEAPQDEVDESIAFKYLLGDPDIKPNIVVSENSAAPIDFDMTGDQGRHSYDEMLDQAEEVYDHLNWDISRERIESTVENLADTVPVERIDEAYRRALDEAPENESAQESLIDNSLENFRRFE